MVNWKGVNKQIISQAQKLDQQAIPGTEELQRVVDDEIAFQKAIWQGDYVKAFAKAENILANLNGEVLRGYRALWHYLAGSTAYLGGKSGVQSLGIKSKQQFEQAKKAASGIPWLVALTHPEIEKTEELSQETDNLEQIENIERLLAKLGTLHSRKFDELEKEILSGLDDNDTFEEAQKKLGEVLGFISGNDESDAAPDPWWILGKKCIVFEDHAGAKDTTALGATKARQAASHPRWMRDNVKEAEECEILSVLLSPISKAMSGAIPHLKMVGFWKLDDFKIWAKDALRIVRELRTTFKETGDIGWRADALSKLESEKLTFDQIYLQLENNRAHEVLKEA